MTPMDLLALARAFATDGVPQSVEPLGHGNVNATYVVRTDTCRRYVLQQLNTTVFTRPELVMANLEALATHATAAIRDDALWQLPLPIPLRSPCHGNDRSGAWLRTEDQGFWRMLTFVEGAHSLDVLQQENEAFEVGRALGCFHALIHDLPTERLTDTLEGFHVTPGYHRRYLAVIASAAVWSSERVKVAGIRSNRTGRYFSLLRSRPRPVARMRRWSEAMARPGAARSGG